MRATKKISVVMLHTFFLLELFNFLLMRKENSTYQNQNHDHNIKIKNIDLFASSPQPPRSFSPQPLLENCNSPFTHKKVNFSKFPPPPTRPLHHHHQQKTKKFYFFFLSTFTHTSSTFPFTSRSLFSQR